MEAQVRKLIVAVAMVVASPVRAEEAPILFRDLHYGETMAAVMARHPTKSILGGVALTEPVNVTPACTGWAEPVFSKSRKLPGLPTIDKDAPKVARLSGVVVTLKCRGDGTLTSGGEGDQSRPTHAMGVEVLTRR